MATHLLEDQPWISGHYQCQDAETAHFERLSGVCSPSKGGCKGAQHCQNTSSLVTEIKKAREQIQKSLQSGSSGSVDSAVVARVDQLEKENKDLKKVTQDLMSMIKKLDGRVCALEKSGGNTPTEKADEPKPVSDEEDEDDDDNDFDMFGDDDIDEAAEKLKEERLKQYAEKKSKKPQLIAKSSVVLDVKPWDDETDMKKLENCVRTVEMEGLVWGASKLVPVGYGIKKLQIVCVIEDDKVSTEELQETIEGFEDFIQSTDIAAFQKI